MDIDTIRQYFNNGQYRECVESSLKIISSNIANIEAWGLCALSYENLGRRDEAIECLQEALKIDKMQGGQNSFNLSLNLAEFYRRSNMTLKAIALLSVFLPCNDENLHFNLAKCYADLQDYEQSIKHYMMAIKINPKDVHAMFNLANQQAAIGSFRMALKYYLLAYEGGIGDAGINLAQIYVDLDKLDEAIKIYRDLESMYSGDSNFYFNYANALRFAGHFELSKNAYLHAMAIRFDPRYAINLSHLLLSANDFENGFMLYENRRSLLTQPHAKNIAKHFLDFGFNTKGEILSYIKNKRVALYHEQGFGDSIMFARFIPELECGKKILYLPKELSPLFSGFNADVKNVMTDEYDIAIPIPSLAFLLADNSSVTSTLSTLQVLFAKSIEGHENSEKVQKMLNIESNIESILDEKQEVNISILESNSTSSIPLRKFLSTYNLPLEPDSNHTFVVQNKQLIKPAKSKIPKTPFANQAKQKHNARQKHSYSIENQAHSLEQSLKTYNRDKLLIGLNFSSNPNFEHAREKSIYPQKLLESLPKDRVQYVSLQYEGIDSALIDEYNIIDACKYIGNFRDSALIVSNLDMVISIDSALAHLSASMGVETLVLLHKKHDWRWGSLDMHDSTIWYEHARLFIQEKSSNWNAPLKNMCKYVQNRIDDLLGSV